MDKGNQRSVLVQRIEDDTLGGNRKTQMLREFDAHVRIGCHLNVVCIVGLMEEFSVISVAFEYETATLKNHLVESRAVQHYPVYAEKNRRFSTLVESQVSRHIYVGFKFWKKWRDKWEIEIKKWVPQSHPTSTHQCHRL